MLKLWDYGDAASGAIPRLEKIVADIPVEKPAADFIKGSMSADDAIAVLEKNRPDSILLARIKDERPITVEETYRNGRYSMTTFVWGVSRMAGYNEIVYAEERAFAGALRLLVELGKENESRDVITDIITGDYPPGLQQYVINSLNDLAFPAEFAVSLLKVAVESDVRDVKEAAIVNLGKTRPASESAVSILTDLLDDPDDGYRFNAVKAFGFLPGVSDEILARLRDMASNDSNEEIRGKAMEVITTLEQMRRGQ